MQAFFMGGCYGRAIGIVPENFPLMHGGTHPATLIRVP
jgi:hypothetical protein